MTGYYLAGSWLLLVAAVICVFAGVSRAQRRTARFDAEYDALRTSGMGDIATVEPSPIHDQLAAEFVVASAGAILAGEWARADVYDVDGWTNGGTS